MAILDDLEGVLGKDQIAKINANLALKSKLTRGDELLGYYSGESAEPPATEPTSRTAADPAAGVDLKSIEALLDSRLAKLPETVEAAVNTLVEKRGKELTANASSMALRNADELNRVYRRHEKDFGEDFDSKAFNDYVEAQQKTGRSFQSVTAAYEDWTNPRRTEKEKKDARAEGVREGLKQKANAGIPGVTPPSSKSPIAFFQNRGRSTGGDNKTALEKAGEALAARRAAHTDVGA